MSKEGIGMKQKYEKPSVLIEEYRISQSISACDHKIGFMDTQCVLNDNDATDLAKEFAESLGYFMQEGGCDAYSVGINDGYDGICYHTNANAMFSS